jgi:cell division protein FtsB
MKSKSINRNVWTLTLILCLGVLGYATLRAQTADASKGAERNSARQSKGESLKATQQSEKQEVKLQIDDLKRKWPTTYNKKLNNDAKRFLTDLKPLVSALQDSRMDDAAYTAAAQKVADYLSKNTRILNDPKVWPNPRSSELASALLIMFPHVPGPTFPVAGDPMARKRWRSWCWSCLAEFILSIF